MELDGLDSLLLYAVQCLEFYFRFEKYRDWNGIRSKVKFQKRLKELTERIKLIAAYRNSPTTLLLMGQETIFASGVQFLISFLLFIIGSILPPFTLFFFIIAGYIVLAALAKMQVGSKLIHDANVPDDFARHVLAFVAEGKRKGFLPKDDNTMQDLLREHLLVAPRDELIERNK